MAQNSLFDLLPFAVAAVAILGGLGYFFLANSTKSDGSHDIVLMY